MTISLAMTQISEYVTIPSLFQSLGRTSKEKGWQQVGSYLVFIGPESDHWLCMSLTHSLTDSLTDSLTHSCLVNLIDVTLACELPTQNLLRLLLLLMLMLRIMLATVCYRFGSWHLVLKLNYFQTLSTRVGQDFDVEVQQDFETGVCSAFCRWCFVEVMKLNLGWYSEARLGQDFEF